MIDHCFLSVNDWKKSRNFYDATLKILGYERILTFEIDENMAMAGYGSNKKSAFWIEKSPGITLSKEGGKARGVGIAFAAPSVEAIHAWFDACLSHGATEDEKPEHKPDYHPGYFGASVIDPNGWRIEAVLHTYKK